MDNPPKLDPEPVLRQCSSRCTSSGLVGSQKPCSWDLRLFRRAGSGCQIAPRATSVLVGDSGGMRTALPGGRPLAQSPTGRPGRIPRGGAPSPLLVGVGPGTMNAHYLASREWA